jgi:hypothetical protein
MKDQDIYINAPYGNYKSVRMLGDKPAVWIPETYRLLADIKELILLRKSTTRLEKTCMSRSKTICEQSHMIADLQKVNAELKESLDDVCVAVFDNRGKAVTANTLNITRKVTRKFNLPLKVGTL